MDYETLGEKIIHQLDEAQVDDLSEILLNTQEQCQMVEKLIKDQIQMKDALIDKLHAELESYKKDSADRYVDQVMKAVIKVRKDMGRKINTVGWNDLSADNIKKEYTYIFEDLTDLLEQQNIDVYITHPGEAFDAAKHQPKVEQTDNPLLDKTVKESISEGYKKGDKSLILERVIVYQYNLTKDVPRF